MNLVEYVKKFGHISFEEMSFNVADSLVLCQFIYLNLNHCLKPFSSERVSIHDALNLDNVNEDLLVYETIFEKNSRLLFQEIRNSNRFANITMSYLECEIDTTSESQFFALTYFLPTGEMIITFRGTDGTLIGWKEDLNMAFLLTVPGQIKALEYTNKVLKENENIPFIIAGHSKGGNLAFFSAMKMDEKHLPFLKKVYNHDGPGFKHPEKLFDLNKMEQINALSLKTVPHASVVGVLLSHDTDVKIVKAKQIYLLQHDLFSWQINEENLQIEYLPEYSAVSNVNEVAMKNLLKNISEEDLKDIADSILELLGGKNVTLFDLASDPLSYLIELGKTYSKYPLNKRMRLYRFTGAFIFQWSKAALGVTKEKVKKEKDKLFITEKTTK
jgi:hypothetical protein